MADNYLIATSGSISWATGANWSTGSAPAAGDRVFITQGSAKIDSGLTPALTAANKLAGLYIFDGFTGEIGTSALTGGYLVLDADEVFINRHANTTRNTSTGIAAGSQWMKLGFTTTTPLVVVEGTAEPKNGTSGYEAVLLKINNSAAVVEIRDGVVGIGNDNGATGAIGQLNVNGGLVNAYDGVTITNVDQDDGELSILKAALTVLKQRGGRLTTWGDALVATATIAGQANFNHRKSSAGNSHTTLTIIGGGTVDFSGNPASVLIANPILARKDSKVVAAAADQVLVGGAGFKVKFDGCEPEDVEIAIPRANVQAEYTAY